MLSPYRVLDLTDERGQLASYLLAVLGADVVAVEAPGGSTSRLRLPLGPNGSSLAHLAYNRGKRSVVIDQATAAGKQHLVELAKGADILFQAGSPAELAARPVGHDELMAANPALVVVTISPFGLDGPKADWAAADLTVWASAGPLAITGDADRPPVAVSVPQAFLHASSTAAAGALLALAERNRSGVGQHVDISAQIASMVATQSAVLTAAARSSPVVRSGGGIRGGDIFLRFVYPAADGHVSITHVFGAAVGPSTARLMDYLYREGGCDEATRDHDWVDYAMALSDGRESMAGFEDIKAQLARFTATRSKAELFAAALEHRLLLAPVATPAEVLDAEQLASRDYWDRIGAARYPGPWAKTTAVPLRRLPPAPALGADAAALVNEPPRRPAPPAAAPPAAATAAPATGRPLEGLKVVDFMWAVAGPTMSRALADAGATVVKVESSSRLDAARAFLPFFDNVAGVERSALFNNLGAGKLGLTLNLADPAGRQVALDLARWADVVCESYSPRAMVAFGLDYEQLKAVNPSLVMMSTCLFGQSGPLSGFAGYGNLAAAMTGFNNLTGWPDGDPVGPFGAYTDYSAPAISLATLLAAIDHQRRTGVGQYLDFSQAEASLHYLAPALLDHELNGRVVERAGNAHPELCPHAVFPAAGADRWVAVVAQDDAAWHELAALIGRADLASLTASERLGRREELERLVASWTAGLEAADVEKRCQAVGVAAHQVQNAPELAADPQLAHLGHWLTVEHPVIGDTVVEGPRFRLSRTPLRPTRGAPTLGEHVMEVLADLLGYDTDRIAELAAAEVLE